MVRRRDVLATLGAVMAEGAGCGGPRGRPLKIVLPDAANAQFMAFWVALGAGLFREEGLDVEITHPSHPRLAADAFLKEPMPLAVLPPPLYFALIASGTPVRLVASLLRRDAISVVAHPSVVDKLPPAEAPLAERVAALRGLRVGLAHGPDERLVVVLAAAGLTLDDVTVVTLPGPEQNPAFEAGRVDALFAHTPFLERAVVKQRGVAYVRPPEGEVAKLADLQIHALVTTQQVIDTSPDVVAAAVRAIARALALVSSQAAGSGLEPLRAALPDRDPAELGWLAPHYAGALPSDPEVTLARAQRTLELFPPHGNKKVSEAALAAAIENRFAARGEDGGRLPAWLVPAAAAAGALGGVLAWRAVRRSRTRRVTSV